MNFAEMPSSHFLFIPAVLLIGMVLGWVLGSRAARDAYAGELKKREARQQRERDRAASAGQPPQG